MYVIFEVRKSVFGLIQSHFSPVSILTLTTKKRKSTEIHTHTHLFPTIFYILYPVLLWILHTHLLLLFFLISITMEETFLLFFSPFPPLNFPSCWAHNFFFFTILVETKATEYYILVPVVLTFFISKTRVSQNSRTLMFSFITRIISGRKAPAKPTNLFWMNCTKKIVRCTPTPYFPTIPLKRLSYIKGFLFYVWWFPIVYYKSIPIINSYQTCTL